MTSSNDGVLGGPYEGDERESGHADGANYRARPWIDDANGTIVTFANILNITSVKGIKWTCLRMQERSQMGRKKRCGPSLPRGWRIHRKQCQMEAFHPRTWAQALITHRQFPDISMRGQYPLLVDILDVRGKDTSLHVCTSSSQQDIVRMPVEGKDSRSDRFLEELRDPPVALFVEGADRDGSNNRSMSTRMARRTPL